MCLRIMNNGEGHQRPNGMIKIGAVAQRFQVSVDLLRLYEREGLLIPLKSEGGTRYYTEHDYLWIGTLLRLVREARLNLAGIRHLLALVPCSEMKHCGCPRASCPIIRDARTPCWANRKTACGIVPDCYYCEVYRSAPSCDTVAALLVARPPWQEVSAGGSRQLV